MKGYTKKKVELKQYHSCQCCRAFRAGKCVLGFPIHVFYTYVYKIKKYRPMHPCYRPLTHKQLKEAKQLMKEQNNER